MLIISTSNIDSFENELIASELDATIVNKLPAIGNVFIEVPVINSNIIEQLQAFQSVYTVTVNKKNFYKGVSCYPPGFQFSVKKDTIVVEAETPIEDTPEVEDTLENALAEIGEIDNLRKALDNNLKSFGFQNGLKDAKWV